MKNTLRVLCLAFIGVIALASPLGAAPNQTGDVYYSYSVNGGTTWSSNLRLSNSTSPLLASNFNDFLTVISSGSRAHAAYSQDTDGDGVYEALLTTLTFH